MNTPTKINKARSNKRVRTLTHIIPDSSKFQEHKSDFRELKRVIQALETKISNGGDFSEEDNQDLLNTLLNLRDANGFISSVIVQDIFGIDHKKRHNSK